MSQSVLQVMVVIGYQALRCTLIVTIISQLMATVVAVEIDSRADLITQTERK